MFLGREGCRLLPHTGFQKPMYRRISEVLALVVSRLDGAGFAGGAYAGAVESGAIEEYVVYQQTSRGKKPLFRVWPELFTEPKALKYQFFIHDEAMKQVALECFSLFAQAHGADLVPRR